MTAMAFIAGCVTPVEYQVSEPLVARSLSFALQDQRSNAEPLYCGHGVHRIRDEQITPDRIKLLGNALESKFGPQLAGKVVAIKRFDVVNQSQVAMSAPVYTGGTAAFAGTMSRGEGGGAGAWVPRPCDKLLSERNPNPYPAIIVDIELTVDARPVSTYWVQYTPIQEPYAVAGELTQERVRKAVTTGISKMQDEVGKALSKI